MRSQRTLVHAPSYANCSKDVLQELIICDDLGKDRLNLFGDIVHEREAEPLADIRGSLLCPTFDHTDAHEETSILTDCSVVHAGRLTYVRERHRLREVRVALDDLEDLVQRRPG